MKVNFGCGKDIRKSFINVDNADISGLDIKHDLNKLPYPFESNSVDYALMKDILEHLKDPINVLKEVHRILKKNGILEIEVPYPYGLVDISEATHINHFHPLFFKRLNPNNKYHFYTPINFRIYRMSVKLIFFKISFPSWFWIFNHLIPGNFLFSKVHVKLIKI